MIRLLLADDETLLRRTLRLLFDNQPDIEVTAEAGDGHEAIRGVLRHRPDVALVDIRMPGPDGVEVARRIRSMPDVDTRVVMLTTFDADEDVDAALRAGARGFALKTAPPEDLLATVRAVAAGEAMLAPSVTRRLLDVVLARPAARQPLPHSVTDREREVLAGVARGMSNGEIALTLFLSEATVRTYVSRILAKTGLRDRTQLAVAAHERGWLPR